ncbi:ComEA family DNA-binding protein [Sulfurospirillum sp. 1307]|jgi:competence protein ComEA
MRVLLALILCFGFLFASVDINKADKKEFSTLSGIGMKKAEQIVAFRDKNGCFKSVDDLAKVKGIGKKTIEKNRENLTVSECK